MSHSDRTVGRACCECRVRFEAKCVKELCGGGAIVLQVPCLVKSGVMACFRDAAVEIEVPNVLVC